MLYAIGMLKSTALEYFKTTKAIAAALDISVQAVSQWGPLVPEGSAYKLESFTGGRIKVDAARYLNTSARQQALAEAAQ